MILTYFWIYKVFGNINLRGKLKNRGVRWILLLINTMFLLRKGALSDVGGYQLSFAVISYLSWLFLTYVSIKIRAKAENYINKSQIFEESTLLFSAFLMLILLSPEWYITIITAFVFFSVYFLSLILMGRSMLALRKTVDPKVVNNPFAHETPTLLILLLANPLVEILLKYPGLFLWLFLLAEYILILYWSLIFLIYFFLSGVSFNFHTFSLVTIWATTFLLVIFTLYTRQD